MNTRNTKTVKEPKNKLQRSLRILDSLSQERLLPLLNYLLDYQSATFADLLIHTKLDPEALEAKLDLLCGMSILRRGSNGYGDVYELDRRRLETIAALVRLLGRE
jgi:hypothetical protein